MPNRKKMPAVKPEEGVKSGKISKNGPNDIHLSKALKPVESTGPVSVVKNLYKEHPRTANRSPGEVNAYRTRNQITVIGPAPNPILSFVEALFPDFCMEEIRRQRYKQPTSIQAQGWPIALSGNNMLAITKMVFGKTLAYILPAIVHIKEQRPLKKRDGPIVLILVPNRELAQQIKTVVDEFGKSISVKNTCIYGGVSKFTQENDLRAGVHMAIATPGRLINFLNDGTTNLRRCTFIVLDEVDRMLEMGFGPQIRQIFAEIPPGRQTLMWSATCSKEVSALADELLGDYIQMKVGSLELVANRNIKQSITICEEAEKGNNLRELLHEIYSKGKQNAGKIIIFAETKDKVDRLCKFITKAIEPCGAIHGDISQSEREHVINAFRQGTINILVSTHKALHGFEVDKIGHVINFDYPRSADDYIHRISRTGRKGATGCSYTFLTKYDAGNVEDLIKVLREANQPVPAALEEMAKLDPIPLEIMKMRRLEDSGLGDKEGMARASEGRRSRRKRKQSWESRENGQTSGIDVKKSLLADNPSSRFPFNTGKAKTVAQTRPKTYASQTKPNYSGLGGTGGWQNRSGMDSSARKGDLNTGNYNRNSYAGAYSGPSRRMEEDSFKYRPNITTDRDNYGFSTQDRERYMNPMGEDRFTSATNSNSVPFNYQGASSQRFQSNNESNYAANSQQYKAASSHASNNTEDLKRVIEMLLDTTDLGTNLTLDSDLKQSINTILNIGNVLSSVGQHRSNEVNVDRNYDSILNSGNRGGFDAANNGDGFRDGDNFNRYTTGGYNSADFGTRDDRNMGSIGNYNSRDNTGYNMRNSSSERYNIGEDARYDNDGIFSRRNEDLRNTWGDSNTDNYSRSHGNFDANINQKWNGRQMNGSFFETIARRGRYD